MHTILRLENLKGRNPLHDLGIDRNIVLELIFEKQGGKLWTRCIWRRIGISGGPLLRR
jgi:hypothetical protein